MTVEMLIQLVMSLGVLPALFIFLFMHTLKQHEKDKEESKAREERLMTQLDRYNQSLEKIAQSQEMLNMRMDRIEQICER